MSLSNLFAGALNGLLLGGLYACAALGLSLMFGVMRFINLAHGELLVIAAYLVFALSNVFGLNPITAMLLVIPVLFVIGYVMQLGLINPLMGKGAEPSLLTAFGLSIIAQNVIIAIWGGNSKSLPSSAISQGSFNVLGSSVPYLYVIAFVVGGLLTWGLQHFITRTPLGRAIRASSLDATTARVMGINVNQIYALTAAIGAMTAAIAGTLIGLTFSFTPTAGFTWLLKGFVWSCSAVWAVLRARSRADCCSGCLRAWRGLRRHGLPRHDRLRDLLAGPVLPASRFVRSGWNRMNVRALPWIALALAAIALVFVPSVFERYVIFVIYFFLLNVALAQSWNLVGGFTGLVSLGHVAFIGIGAYTSSILIVSAHAPIWLAFLAGGLMAALFAFVISFATFRSRGVYFAIGTLVLAEALRLWMINWEFTGGAQGVQLPIGIGPTREDYFYLMLGLAVGSTALVMWIMGGKLGLGLKAIRDNEDSARNMGVDVFRTKLTAFLISAFIAGLVGAVHAGRFGPVIVNPSKIVISTPPSVMAFTAGVNTAASNVIESAPAIALASRTFCRNEPVPLSLVLRTTSARLSIAPMSMPPPKVRLNPLPR